MTAPDHRPYGFSPLIGGARPASSSKLDIGTTGAVFQSPHRRGTSCERTTHTRPGSTRRFQSPHRRGTSCELASSSTTPAPSESFSPLIGGARPASGHRLHKAEAKVEFQSPHRRGTSCERDNEACKVCSVSGFSPLIGGARPASSRRSTSGRRSSTEFQSPHRRGTSCEGAGRYGGDAGLSFSPLIGGARPASFGPCEPTCFGPQGFSPLIGGARPASAPPPGRPGAPPPVSVPSSAGHVLRAGWL